MAYSKMTEDIIAVIRSIPPGYVSSYGVIAQVAGYGNGARQVVRILSTLSEQENLPWHRVVNKQGKIMLRDEGECEQILLLEREGVHLTEEGFVDPDFFYNFTSNIYD